MQIYILVEKQGRKTEEWSKVLNQELNEDLNKVVREENVED